MATLSAEPQLRRALTFRDLFLFYIVTGFSLRWIATAAAAGPSALVIWIIAALGLFVPLVLTVLELSSRYPEEGGLYVWSKRAFGPFAAFLTGWTYWGSNLPVLSGAVYFAAANALFIGGPSWQTLSGNSTYFICVATAGLILAVVMNLVGLNIGKWLSNVGAIAGWLPALLLIVLGIFAWRVHGSATDLAPRELVPSTSLKDVIFWSTIAFAYGGIESGSTMGDEIHDARRTVPRAVLAAGVVITALYVIATLERADRDSEDGSLRAPGHHAGGAVDGWPRGRCGVARAGCGASRHGERDRRRRRMVCRHRPSAVRRRDRSLSSARVRSAAPDLAHALCGAAGAGRHRRAVRLPRASGHIGDGAYDALVSMGIIAYFIPFLFMFAAMIKLQGEPAGPGVMRVPGGKWAAIAVAAVGFATTAISIVLACVPADDEPNKMLAVVKVIGSSVVLVSVGVVVYVNGRAACSAGGLPHLTPDAPIVKTSRARHPRVDRRPHRSAGTRGPCAALRGQHGRIRQRNGDARR